MNLLLGILGLSAMWTAALLVAAAAWQDRRALQQLWQRFRPLNIREGDLGVGAVRGKIEARGPDRIFAVHEVAQVGRAVHSEVPTIAFRDAASTSRSLGGFVSAAGISLRIPEGEARVSVWTQRVDREEAAACGDAFSFEAAYLGAKSAKGTRRTVTTALRAGDPILVAGEVVLEDRKVAVVAPRTGTLGKSGKLGNLILASFDPRPGLQRQMTVIALFIAAELLLCALCTGLALWPPVFGAVSSLGAVLCLAFFLGVTPVGVELHDWCQPPDRAPLHGEWTRAETAAAAPAQGIELDEEIC